MPVAGTTPPTDSEQAQYVLADDRIAADLAVRLSAHTPVIDVWNKTDLCAQTPAFDPDRAVCLSARTGEGLEQLRRQLLHIAGWSAVPEGVFMARERHVQALQRVGVHVAAAIAHVAAAAQALDLVAEELRLAQNALGEITGAFGADDLLGVIFSRFCIGK